MKLGHKTSDFSPRFSTSSIIHKTSNISYHIIHPTSDIILRS